MFTPSFTPRGEHLHVTVKKNEGANREFHPYGDNFTPRGHSSPLGSKFAPRGEVKNGHLATLIIPDGVAPAETFVPSSAAAAAAGVEGLLAGGPTSGRGAR
jgi:hypothetical protein